MTRRELVLFLYQYDPPTSFDMYDNVLSKTELHLCKNKLPTENGDYLVRHAAYGWCLYGFTVKDHWGDDDLVVRKDGSSFNKVIEWGRLDFLEEKKD